MVLPLENESVKYKDVGIDIKKIKLLQNQIGKNIEKTKDIVLFSYRYFF